METQTPLHRIPPPAWNRVEACRPDPIEMLRRRKPPTWLETLIADWREATECPFFSFFVGGVAGSLLVCVLAFFWGTL